MKQIKIVMLAILCALTFTACDEDENSTWTPKSTDTELYVLNQGSYSSGIDGSLTTKAFDGTLTNWAFKAANNGVSLGNTPQEALIYGSHIYFAVSGDQTGGYVVFIADRNTLKIQKQINMYMPRDIVAHAGKVYLSGWGDASSALKGQVARIDTTDLAIDATIMVGEYPEELVAANGYLYVTNSNYGLGTTVSKVNINTFTEEKKITVGLNPTRIAADISGNVFVVTTGDYFAIPASVKKISVNDEVTDVVKASFIAINGTTLYALNSVTDWTTSPYQTVNTYSTVDTSTGKVLNQQFISGSNTPTFPINIFVNPRDGSVCVLADNDEGGYANWGANGYLYQYDSKGRFVKKTNVGVHPVSVVFNTH